jgi:hypothetical protein
MLKNSVIKTLKNQLRMNNQEFSYFTDYVTNKSAKIGISALVGKLSPKISSHKSAWCFMIANQLTNAGFESVDVITSNETDWNNYDIILIDHGMEFKGNFNIFGGANDDLYNQIIRIKSKVKMYSLHHEMPCIGALIEQRLKTGTDLFKTLEQDIDLIKGICANDIPKIDHIEKTDKLCFGDSHSFGMYQAGYMCQRHDGLTMHGALKRGLDSYIYPWIKTLTCYMGNIDVRHHLMRQANPKNAVEIMMKNYEQQLKALQENGVSNIELIHVLPIENESRVLPKTGYYKDTPFYGSWLERTQLSKEINNYIDEMCKRNNWKVYKHSDVYFNDKGELTFDVMEQPKSVHISREYYRWDMAANCPNKKLEKKTMSLF